MQDKDVNYYGIKCKMKSILRYNSMLPIIENKVKAVNKVWVEAYFLFNLYIYDSLSNGRDIRSKDKRLLSFFSIKE